MSVLRIGVIGAGLMGTTHARLLSSAVPGAQLVAVSDAIADGAERLAGEVGVDTVHPDGLDLIRDSEVDAVVIASPAAIHEPFVLACFEANKPVLCEKPLAADAEAARRALDAEMALGRRLVQVGCAALRPGYADLKARLDGGQIGAALLAHCAHRNPTVPPAFGTDMILTDSVVHDVDTLRWLLGEELVRVRVLTPRPTGRAPDGVHDPLLVVFDTETGALADVEAFVNAQYAYDIRCEIVGESGTRTLASPSAVGLRQDGHGGTALPMNFQDRFAAAYVAELSSWIASVVTGVPAGASAWDGYAASMVSDAALEALRTGQPAEVRLEDRPDLYADAGRLVARGQ